MATAAKRWLATVAEGRGKSEAGMGLVDRGEVIGAVCECASRVYGLAGAGDGAPEYTANVDGLGTLRLLEAIRILGL